MICSCITAMPLLFISSTFHIFKVKIVCGHKNISFSSICHWIISVVFITEYLLVLYVTKLCACKDAKKYSYVTANCKKRISCQLLWLCFSIWFKLMPFSDMLWPNWSFFFMNCKWWGSKLWVYFCLVHLLLRSLLIFFSTFNGLCRRVFRIIFVIRPQIILIVKFVIDSGSSKRQCVAYLHI